MSESSETTTGCAECGAAEGMQCHPFCLLSTDIIHIYTRGDALRDGALIDITETAREAGFSCPVAITAAAWLDFVKWDKDNAAYQDESGRLWDVLTMARHAARRGGSRSPFQVLRVPNTARATRPRLTTLTLHAGPGDDGELVLTITLPGED